MLGVYVCEGGRAPCRPADLFITKAYLYFYSKFQLAKLTAFHRFVKTCQK